MRTKQTRRFRARLDEAASVSAFVESSIAGVPSRLIRRVQLVVEELFVNTVTHGHGGDCDAPVDISVSLEDEHVTVVYEDTAPAFDPFAGGESSDPAAPLEARSVGHLGLLLISQLTGRREYARTGHRNCVTVALPVR